MGGLKEGRDDVGSGDGACFNGGPIILRAIRAARDGVDLPGEVDTLEVVGAIGEIASSSFSFSESESLMSLACSTFLWG